MGAALWLAAVLPACAESGITLSGNAVFTTDYVFRGFTNSAEKPAVQPEFDLTYKNFYAGIWGSNVNFGDAPNGKDLASVEIDYWAGITPTLGKWTLDIGRLLLHLSGRLRPRRRVQLS